MKSLKQRPAVALSYFGISSEAIKTSWDVIGLVMFLTKYLAFIITLSTLFHSTDIH